MKILLSKVDYIKPYISLKPTRASIRNINEFCRHASFIPGKTLNEKLHTTLVYSRYERKLRDIQKLVRPAMVYKCLVKDMEIFSNIEKLSLNLVALLDCEPLQKRHEYLHRDIHRRGQGLKTDFPEYKPHITLSNNPHENDRRVNDFQHGMHLLEIARDELRKTLNHPDSDPLKIYLTKETLEPIKDL